MPTLRVTPAASEVIRRGKALGKSSRELAQTLRDQLGIELDQRTISRHAKSISGKASKAPRKAPPPPATPKQPAPREEVEPAMELNEGVSSLAPTLNEVAALEREVIRLQNLLATDIPNRDRVALVAELRQSMRSIRLASAAAKKGQEAEDQEVAATVAKLKRFALRNVKDFGETGEAEADAAVPEVGSPAIGE